MVTVLQFVRPDVENPGVLLRLEQCGSVADLLPQSCVFLFKPDTIPRYLKREGDAHRIPVQVCSCPFMAGLGRLAASTLSSVSLRLVASLRSVSASAATLGNIT